MNKLSIGARLAWQIASWEAVFTKYQYIEKEHLFIGLLSLQKMKEVDKTLKISQGECQKLNSEKKALDDIFQGLGINITAVRRRLRKSLPKGSFDHKSKIIHRSEECRYIFKRASELVIANVDADVLNILTAILAKPDSIITKCLQDFGVKPKKMWLRTISFETIDEKQTITLDMGKDDFKHIRTFTRRSDVSFLTIMFDDIVSSTALFHKMGDEDFLELIKFHDDTLKNIVKKSGKGEIIKSTGDGLLMVFSSPSVAVKCALEMQKKFLTHQYLKIRIGMDMGEVRKIMDDESRDIFGLKVSTANRITDAALGGHILTSKSVFEEAKKELSDTSIEWRFLGSQSFKPGEPTIDIFEAFHPRFLGRPMSDLSLRIKQKKRESIFIFPTKTPLLDKYGRDLTREAKYGKINPFIGRNDELFNILDILSKKESKNVLLIGLVGVGKSAIVEAVAMNLIDSRGKNQFSRKRLISLNFAKMMSGVKDEREFKSRLKNMFDEAKKESDVILYIDEIHNFIGAGNKNGYMNVTNIFKPAILKHEIQVIGTTTADSFKKYIESDRELMKSFQKIVIEEPSKEETFAILKTFQNKLEEYHQVWITDKALEAAIKLSMQFDPEHNLPAKAIDLMDEAGAHVHIADLHLDGQTILNELSIAKTLSGKLGIPLNKIILSMDN